jgi:hypothetical protein
MAATVSVKTMLKILAKGTSNLADNDALAEDYLAQRQYQGSAQLGATGTQEVTVCAQTPAAARLTSAHVMILATQAANANSRDYKIQYDDGAAGTAVDLTSDLDGTAVAVTQDRVNALTVTAGVIIPAGSRVYLVSTANGCGDAADIQVCVELEYE